MILPATSPVEIMPNIPALREAAAHVSPPSNEAWIAFTPAEVDASRCMARTWGAGRGAQCTKPRRVGQNDEALDFCSLHQAGDKWQAHGRVDGPIPEKKLAQFRKGLKRLADPQVLGTPVKRRLRSEDAESPDMPAKVMKVVKSTKTKRGALTAAGVFEDQDILQSEFAPAARHIEG